MYYGYYIFISINNNNILVIHMYSYRAVAEATRSTSSWRRLREVPAHFQGRMALYFE